MDAREQDIFDEAAAHIRGLMACQARLNVQPSFSVQCLTRAGEIDGQWVHDNWKWLAPPAYSLGLVVCDRLRRNADVEEISQP